MLIAERPIASYPLSFDDASCVHGLTETLIDQVECGLIACRQDGRAIHVNRAAQRELDTAISLKLVDSTVMCTSGSQSALLAALHDAALRQRGQMLVLGPADAELTLVVMPLRPEGLRGPMALLMTGRRDVCSPLALELLSQRHGLTLAEQRVLRALIASRTASEIADSHGVKTSTVRTQIQSIRDKVGVRSIDALLVRAAKVPPIGAGYEVRCT